MYYLLMPSLEARTRFIAQLRARAILAVFHYQPLHLSQKGREYGGRPGQCPVTEDVADRLVRLPFYLDLAGDLQERVIGAVTSLRVGQGMGAARA
jgi:dTDP-4-amino-4,6-dideoxygalactose transaminase